MRPPPPGPSHESTPSAPAPCGDDAASQRSEAAWQALQGAERRAAEAVEHYRELANMLPVLIGETNADGRLTFVNRSGLALVGYGPDEWQGINVIDLIGPEDRARAAQNFGRRMGGEELPAGNYTLVHRDGETLIPIELRAANIVRDGRVVGVRCVILDMRERLAAERERLRYEQRTLDARRLESLGVLAGGVAHDFNNLLAVIFGNADLALLELPLDAPARPLVYDIRTASRRAAELTRQLLAYTGKAPFHRADVDLNALVREVLAGLPRNGTRVEPELAPALPAVHGGAGLLRQSVLNLLTNAREALTCGGGVVRIATSLAPLPAEAPAPPGLVAPERLPPGDYVLLSVSDTGVGLDAQTQARVFEPFFSTKFTGRGLGLAVVLGVVRSHGGGIGIVSAPGDGARFDVYLPVAGAR